MHEAVYQYDEQHVLSIECVLKMSLDIPDIEMACSLYAKPCEFSVEPSG
jgi:hypothetical protein